jgi:hypothetical protein
VSGAAHRLVQAVTRARLTAEAAAQWRQAATAVVRTALAAGPESPATRPTRALLPHALEIIHGADPVTGASMLLDLPAREAAIFLASAPDGPAFFTRIAMRRPEAASAILQHLEFARAAAVIAAISTDVVLPVLNYVDDPTLMRLFMNLPTLDAERLLNGMDARRAARVRSAVRWRGRQELCRTPTADIRLRTPKRKRTSAHESSHVASGHGKGHGHSSGNEHVFDVGRSRLSCAAAAGSRWFRADCAGEHIPVAGRGADHHLPMGDRPRATVPRGAAEILAGRQRAGDAG